jgi:hypothetical protein
LGISSGSLHLVFVDGDASNVAAGKLRDLPGRPTHTTADVEDSHALFDTSDECEVVFMAGDGLPEGLVGAEAAEVEALAPSILIEVGSEVVISADVSG